jgi:hypothetical protein
VGCFSIEHGHHGEINLDGLAFAMALAWPGPIHQGKGRCQPYVDSRADEQQRDALLKIMSGQDSDPFATVFAVFATTFETVHEPMFVRIDAFIDVEARNGRVRIGNLVNTQAEPIRNPVTGNPHRVRIELPNGFEYEVAEIGSATTSARGGVQVELKDSYAQFAYIHMNNHGVIRHRSQAA